MQVETRRVKKEFMFYGQIDVYGDIQDLVKSTYGKENFYDTLWESDDIVYSENFIAAIERDQIPSLKLYPNHEARIACPEGFSPEYHHVIINGECYICYFTEQQD